MSEEHIHSIDPTGSSPASWPLIGLLSGKANVVLSRTDVSPLQEGSNGDFPATLQVQSAFNSATYDWISNRLDGPLPTLSAEKFSAIYGTVLTAIKFQYSTADQQRENNEKQNKQHQEGELVNWWKANFPTIPLNTPDEILTYIAKNWANPSLTWDQLRMSTNFPAVLNRTPPSGNAIIPTVGFIILSVDTLEQMERRVVTQNARVTVPLAAVRNPTVANGGLSLSGTGGLFPAYSVNVSQDYIYAGLQDNARVVSLNMYATGRGDGNAVVFVDNNKSAFILPIDQFLGLTVNGDPNFARSKVFVPGNNNQLIVSYNGVTFVPFGPVQFDGSRFWYAPDVIQEAVTNDGQDVSGLRFVPSKPNINFQPGGSFGFPAAAAISRSPSFSLTIATAKPEELVADFNKSPVIDVSFLGRRAGSFGGEAKRAEVIHGSAVLTLTPPAFSPSANLLSPVLGATFRYPGAV